MPISELGWIYTMGEKNSPPPGPRLVRQKWKSYMYSRLSGSGIISRFVTSYYYVHTYSTYLPRYAHHSTSNSTVLHTFMYICMWDKRPCCAIICKCATARHKARMFLRAVSYVHHCHRIAKKKRLQRPQGPCCSTHHIVLHAPPSQRDQKKSALLHGTGGKLFFQSVKECGGWGSRKMISWYIPRVSRVISASTVCTRKGTYRQAYRKKQPRVL